MSRVLLLRALLLSCVVCVFCVGAVVVTGGRVVYRVADGDVAVVVVYKYAVCVVDCVVGFDVRVG